jgi:DNA helicase II / ATP-dependent DNA helicase PcrA
MISKYFSTCPQCGFKIRIGDEITKSKELGKWVHDVCPKEQKSSYAPKRLGAASQDFSAALETALVALENSEDSFVPVKLFQPSVYQQAIFDFIVTERGNGVAEAVAGSGKTTTLVEALKLTPANSKVVLLAFNKHIAAELRTRVPPHVRVATLHSLGLDNLANLYGLSKAPVEKGGSVDEFKLDNLMDVFWPTSKYRKTSDKKTDLLIHGKKVEIELSERKANREKRSIIRKVVALSKATLVDYDSKEELLDMAERYGIDLGDHEKEILAKVPELMEACKTTDTVDYEDMIWLMVVDKRAKLHTEKFDMIFVDEAQDLNACQIQFVLNSLAPGGRIIAGATGIRAFTVFVGQTSWQSHG